MSLLCAVVLAGCAAREGPCPAPTGIPSLVLYGNCKTYLPPAPSSGQPVYSADECIGPVINGECHGQILPKPGYRPRCYGQMLNGVCTGPMF